MQLLSVATIAPRLQVELLQHIPVGLFVFCFGACVGSFLNVVIYRIPAGMSVINPPSRCPTCGARLSFFKDNLPIIGWLLLRARCRYCKVRISPQYMGVELLIAVLFLLFYVLVYVFPPTEAWAGEITSEWWDRNGPFLTWPAFIALLFLVASLIAMTLIDARTYTIPIQIPLFATVTAFVAYPLQALLPMGTTSVVDWPIPSVGWPVALMSFGAMIGVVIGLVMLKTGRLRYSFSDYDQFLSSSGQDDQQQISTETATTFETLFFLPVLLGLVVCAIVCALTSDPGHVMMDNATPPNLLLAITAGLGAAALLGGGVLFAKLTRGRSGPVLSEPSSENVLAEDYPHARREMLFELAFLAPALALGAGGLALGMILFESGSSPPLVVQAIGASMAGYLLGCAIVWALRILGTLAFGREAIGLGDVHLMGAVGAVLGWFDPILVFFIAPFFGLLWHVMTIALSRIVTQLRQPIPFGPHLAIGTLVMVLCRPVVDGAFKAWFPPEIQMPAPGLVHDAPNTNLTEIPSRPFARRPDADRVEPS